MIRLYSHEAACRFQRRARASLGLSLGLMGTALAVCIFLCTRLTTANAQTLLFATIALFTLAGWAAMLVLYFVYGPARAQASHMLGMLSAQEESYEGTLELTRDTFRIPRSITVCKACMHTQAGSISLNISAGLARQLPRGKRLRVWAVRRYITAYEVLA